MPWGVPGGQKGFIPRRSCPERSRCRCARVSLHCSRSSTALYSTDSGVSQTDWASSSRTFRLCSCEARLRPHPHLAIQVPMGLPSPWSSGPWSHSIGCWQNPLPRPCRRETLSPCRRASPPGAHSRTALILKACGRESLPRGSPPLVQDSHLVRSAHQGSLLPGYSESRVHEDPTALPHNHLISGVTVPSRSGFMRTRGGGLHLQAACTGAGAWVAALESRLSPRNGEHPSAGTVLRTQPCVSRLSQRRLP